MKRHAQLSSDFFLSCGIPFPMYGEGGFVSTVRILGLGLFADTLIVILLGFLIGGILKLVLPMLKNGEFNK
jgi:hypothetical protein